MNINSKTLKDFREDLKRAVIDLEKKYGVAIELGRITYDEEEFRGKLTVVNKANLGDKDSNINKVNWDRNCTNFGFKSEDYGRKIFYQNKYYTIEGINPRKWKYPIILVSNGERYVFPAKLVLDKLK